MRVVGAGAMHSFAQLLEVCVQGLMVEVGFPVEEGHVHMVVCSSVMAPSWPVGHAWERVSEVEGGATQMIEQLLDTSVHSLHSFG